MDIIADFAVGVDFIQLEISDVKLTATQITDMLAGTDTSIGIVTDDGVNTTFIFANGSSLVVNSVVKSQLSAANYQHR